MDDILDSHGRFIDDLWIIRDWFSNVFLCKTWVLHCRAPRLSMQSLNLALASHLPMAGTMRHRELSSIIIIRVYYIHV
jgi:hypothetical protein